MALDTFKARLKEKCKTLGVNLSQKRMDAFADRLHKKFPDIKEDAEHDTAIDELNEVVDLKEVAKLEDQVRTAEAKLKQQKPTPAPKKEDPASDDDDDDDDDAEEGKTETGKPKPKKDRTPAWAKSLIDEVQSLKAEKQKGSIKAKLKETLKDIPESFYEEWSLPEKDEEVEGFETKVKTKWEAFTKDHPVQPSLNGGHKPSRSGAQNDKVDEKEIDAIIDKF